VGSAGPFAAGTVLRVKLVAEHRVLQQVVDSGGDLYLWPRGYRCCAGRSYVLEAATEPPEKAFRRVHEQDGVAVWATPGLAEAEEIHVEIGRRGKLSAFWNGQSWIG
jgi:hypothetical protein